MKYAIIYVFILTLANLLVGYYGPWFSIINAFVLIGLDFVLRDKIHDLWAGKWLPIKMGCLILISGLISYILNEATENIAIASVVAFCLSMIADSIAYHYLSNHNWHIKSNGSNIVGSLVDSIAFPTIAFGSLMPMIILLQFAAKVSGGLIWSVLLNKGIKND